MNVVPFKFTIEGQEIDAYLTEKNWELVLKAINKNKKTGYERVPFGEIYWRDTNLGYVQRENDERCDEDEDMYKVANYYSSKEVAENNARADKLMRQLRRFAVEHRVKKIDWKDILSSQFGIYYMHNEKDNGLYVSVRQCTQDFGGIYFDSKKTAELAINTFYNELIWYFTEYKDSL